MHCGTQLNGQSSCGYDSAEGPVWWILKTFPKSLTCLVQCFEDTIFEFEGGAMSGRRAQLQQHNAHDKSLGTRLGILVWYASTYR
jgi:hypothetical protein